MRDAGYVHTRDLHAMWPISNPIRDLEFAHILYDRCSLLLGDLALWRHITIRPMMLAHAEFGGHEEGSVGMVPRIVDVMDKGWTFFGSGRFEAMTRSTIRLEQGLTC